LYAATGKIAQHGRVGKIRDANVRAHRRQLEIQQADRRFHGVQQIRRASLEVRVELCGWAASDHECVGPVSPAVGELHRPYRIRARDAVPIRLLLLEAVLAQYLVEGERCFST
jgi:hypothetical protein